VAFWIASVRGSDVGFFELSTHRRGVKIEGFGLVPERRGIGLGAGLLTAATRQAFALGAERVWLHTATDDHPHALPNYRSRGFRVYRERELRHPMRTADARPSPRGVTGGRRHSSSRSRGTTRPRAERRSFRGTLGSAR
jgi:hypothetical protein